jgi:transposase-like protein
MTDLAIGAGARSRAPNGADLAPATTIAPGAPDAADSAPAATLPPAPPPATTPAAKRRPPSPRRCPPEKVEAVRRLVVGTDMPITAIAAAEGVSDSAVRNWVHKYNWPRPEGAPPLGVPRRQLDSTERRAKLTVRLYRAVGRQLKGLETRARDAKEAFTEKDARTLGLLARTLTTLTELDRDTGSNVREPEIADRDTIDAELAERIARWAAGEEGP